MSQHTFRRRPVNNSAIPDMVFLLLIANGVVFVGQLWGSRLIESIFALWPLGGGFLPWQLLTYGFLHDTSQLTHILFNMFALWMFGRQLEQVMGPRRFMTYYIVCVVGAGVVQLIVAGITGSPYPTIGASGGVFGILLAYGMIFPNSVIMLIFPPIPMKAKYFVVVFGLIELYLGLSGSAPGVANFAHLGGMLFGFILLRRWRVRRM